MKKILAVALAFGIICVSFTRRNAVAMADIGKVVYEKIEFAQAMNERYNSDVSQYSAQSNEELDIKELISDAYFATNEEKAILNARLEELGVYRFISKFEVQEGISTYSVGTGDVSLGAPEIFYIASDQTWVVSCGGYWLNSNATRGLLIGGNVGDPDGFGVGYTNITSSYQSMVVASYAYITDHANVNKVTTSNRSDGDGGKGFGFRLQDRFISTPTFSCYIGYKWYGSCTYDSSFATYDAIATSYYIHTYRNAKISSINFGVNGSTAGLNTTITNINNSFTAFSTDSRV